MYMGLHSVHYNIWNVIKWEFNSAGQPHLNFCHKLVMRFISITARGQASLRNCNKTRTISSHLSKPGQELKPMCILKSVRVYTLWIWPPLIFLLKSSKQKWQSVTQEWFPFLHNILLNKLTGNNNRWQIWIN
jgi:hypothetical protein